MLAELLILNIPEQDAKDRLWRRETNKVGQGAFYQHSKNPGPNTLFIEHHEPLEGIEVILSARLSATISPLTPEHLAALAIESSNAKAVGAMA